MKRCYWSQHDEQEAHYHDTEWGVPLHNDKKHFEFILLDGFQAGLSWRTILHKRKNFAKAFNNFDYKKIAKYDEAKVQALMQDIGIIRNQLKIRSSITNALSFMEVQKEFGSFDQYIWSFTGGKTIKNKWKSHSDIPATTAESDAMSKDLKKRGFKFVGSTICYAYMQAAGMVNDHTTDCFRYKEV
jgi:DNA-3-methyladenine glycosylase I